MPLAVLLVLLYSIYSSKPVGVIDSLTVSSVFIFLVMVWIGATACDMENAVSEQILILRMQSAVKYYISHTVFLFLMGMMVSLIGILFPVIMDLCSQGQLFDFSMGFELEFFSVIPISPKRMCQLWLLISLGFFITAFKSD